MKLKQIGLSVPHCGLWILSSLCWLICDGSYKWIWFAGKSCSLLFAPLSKMHGVLLGNLAGEQGKEYGLNFHRFGGRHFCKQKRTLPFSLPYLKPQSALCSVAYEGRLHLETVFLLASLLSAPCQRPDALGTISRLQCPQTCAPLYLCLCPYLHQTLSAQVKFAVPRLDPVHCACCGHSLWNT